MSQTLEDKWYEVQEAVTDAKGIAFDGCHKIYVLLDNEQVHLMAGYGYGEDGSFLFTKQHLNEAEMLNTLKGWYEKSCALKFVEAVVTVQEGQDPNEGFSDLIEQGFEEEDEDEDLCVNCGFSDASFNGYCDTCLEEEEEDEDEE